MTAFGVRKARLGWTVTDPNGEAIKTFLLRGHAQRVANALNAGYDAARMQQQQGQPGQQQQG